MNTLNFTLFWLTGDTQIVTGIDIASAMNNAGIGNGALRALDFYSSGDKSKEYTWNSTTRYWDKVKDTITGFEILEQQGINPADFQGDI